MEKDRVDIKLELKSGTSLAVSGFANSMLPLQGQWFNPSQEAEMLQAVQCSQRKVLTHKTENSEGEG